MKSDEKKIPKYENQHEGEFSPESGDKLREEDVAKVKKAIDQAHIDASTLSEHDQEILRQMHEAAKLPIELDDFNFKMGEQELDVRKLSRTNWRQMEFRQLVLQNIYLKQIVMGNTDILRMLMVIADKLGVEDIVGATDEVIDRIEAKEKEKQNNKLN